MKWKILLWLLAVAVLSILVPEATGAAVVEDVSFEVESGITRLGVVINGELPLKVSTDGDNKVTVVFDNLKISPTMSEKLKNLSLPSGIKSFEAKEGPEGALEISFFARPEYVERLILPVVPPTAGKYRLILDMLFPPKAGGQGVEQVVRPSEPFKGEGEHPKGPEVTAKGEETRREGGIVPFVEAFYEEAVKAFSLGHYKRAFVLFDRYLQKGGETHRVDALYGRAFSFYEMHRGEEANFGFDMIQLFGEAISADNTHEKAFQAQCTIAMIYFDLGVTKKAADIFEELKAKAKTDEERLCALKGLGIVSLKNGDPIRALTILNEALGIKAPPEKQGELYFLLGEALLKSEAYSEALKKLGQALNLKPDIYLEKPELIKLIGDAFFALGDYQSAQEFLLWYLNLNDRARDDSMVWAEIAESMLQSGKTNLAERLQDKIIVEMPDTEGAYITLLRKAQYLEQKGSGGRFQAETIYQDLSQKNLPLPLKEVAFFRWADLKRREGKIYEAMEIVDRFLSTVPPSSPMDNFLAFKSSLLNEAVIESFRKEAYRRVVELYEGAGNGVSWSPDALEAVASSYEKLEMHPQALGTYEKLVAAGKESEALYLSMARIAYLLGDMEKAEKYAGMLKKPENLVEKFKLLARVYMERKDYASALGYFDKLNALRGMTPELMLLYIQCAASLNRCDLVFKIADELFSKKDGVSNAVKYEALSQKLECYRKGERLDEAIQTLQEMVKLASEETVRCQTLYLLASLQRQKGNREETELTLQELSKCGDPLWKKVAERELAFMKLTEGHDRP